MPESAWHALRGAMPDDVHAFRVGHREAGLGSLGRQRFTAVVDDWHGGVLAREAKALAPSAWRWWTDEGRRNTSWLYMTVIGLAVRSRDPRCSCSKATNPGWCAASRPTPVGSSSASLPKAGHLEDDLLRAMGRETANVHVPLGDVLARLRAANEERPGLAVRRCRQDGRQGGGGPRGIETEMRARWRPAAGAGLRVPVHHPAFSAAI